MARRCLPLFLSALLLAPASAHADFAETPTYGFTGEPSCVAPTGAPGEVAIGSSSGASFLQATRTGYAPAGEVKAGEGFTCGTVVSRPSGAGVIAGTQYYGDSVVAVVRDPGGTWSAPISVAQREGWTPQSVVGAVSERGDVVVAWLEERSRPESALRVRIAQRAPGGDFGPAQVVQASTTLAYPRAIDAAISATGEAVVSWTAVDVAGKGEPRLTANVATIAPGGAVGAPASVPIDSTTSLSVAGDGRTLLAYVHDGSVHYIERAPGAAFGAPVRLARITDPTSGTAIARLHDSGAAAIAWSGNLLSEVRIATRPGLGGFRPAVTVAKGRELPKDYDPFFSSPEFFAFAGSDTSLESLFFLDDALTLTEDGHALLGLTTMTRTRGAETYVARLATVPLTGAAAVGAGAGGEFDIPLLAQPMVLADGTPALTWVSDVEENHFVLHLAMEGGTRPATAMPNVRVGAPVKRVLGYGDALRLPIRCSGPCSVRAQVIGRAGSDGLTTLVRGGRGELRIEPGTEPIARRKAETVRVRVTYGAPGSVRPRTQTVSVRIQRSNAPRPRLVGVEAVRRGNQIEVSWRIKHPPRFAAMFVSGSHARDDRGRPLVVSPEIIERTRTSYRVDLQPATRVRYVTLRPYGDDRLPKRTTVRVR